MKKHYIYFLSTIFIFGILVIVTYAWMYQDIQSRTGKLEDLRVKLTSNFGRIMHLDEVLTMSARMAAASGDLGYEDRYNFFDPELDKLIKETKALVYTPRLKRYVEETDAANQRLVAMGHRSFELDRAGRGEEALTLLNSAQYNEDKKRFSEGMKQIFAVIHAEEDTRRKEILAYEHFSRGLGAVGLAVVLLGWLFSVRAVLRLKRLDEKLQNTQTQLEVKVRERTAELETANEALRKDAVALREAEEHARKISEDIVKREKALLNVLVDLKKSHKHLEETQRQLSQAQKMEAIGRLTGGIAHDFNNLLTVINGFAGLLLDRIPKQDPAHADLEEILNAGKRATNLTSQLLAFSRQRIIEPKVVDLNGLILNFDKMLRRLIGENIELHIQPASGLWPVKIDSSQAEQLLANLAVNSRDAITDTGKIIIETKNVNLDEEYGKANVEVVPGDYVMLAFNDTGCGMTSEIKEHLFEPFFTTKEEGKGTGLGLSICFGIVKQSGGLIKVYSEPGHGTTFKVYFPRTYDEPVVVSKEGKLKSLHGTETVLLVEDEKLVRDFGVRVLSGQGYIVLQAANGEEALRLAKAQAEKGIQLLLTDMIMPKMGGKDLFDNLKTFLPKLKALFTSGYTDSSMIQQGVLDQSIMFIQKPFSGEALLVKVREALNK